MFFVARAEASISKYDLRPEQLTDAHGAHLSNNLSRYSLQ